MNAVRTEWKTQDGTNIFAQYWTNQGELKGLVCLVHGFGEHSSRYAHVAEMLNQNGYALYAFDHRGHGRSEGTRGHINSFSELIEEVDLLLENAQKQFPDVPVFLYGHSWGGGIVGNYLVNKQTDLQGAIITGAWFRLATPAPAFQVFLAKIMNVIWPSLTQSSNLDTAFLSHNQSVIDAYKNDPLVHGKISPRLFLETAAAGEFSIANAKNVKIPVIIMHGSDDQITSPKGSEEFHAGIPARSSLKIYEGQYHEIHNEVENSLVLADMLQFLNSHL
ncbi:MAG TPA: alpha/beta hydrolase [Bacteroidetes bacterium]|nr:alpha/beta hydrolase [Bacteroidota bacterium]